RCAPGGSLESGRRPAGEEPPRRVRRNPQRRPSACRTAAVGAGSARPRARDGALFERALVLLSGAESRAGCSVVGMRRVLLLATTTGYQTRAFGDAAGRLGVELVFATDRCHMIDDPWRDGAIPIRFYDESASVAAILETAKALPIDGVLVVGDRPTVIA